MSDATYKWKNGFNPMFEPTIWQRAQSYFSPVLIERTSSPHNPYLEVVLRRGRLQLLTENAIYSYADLYDNFSKVFDKLHLTPVQRVLVLGFGLGSISFMLEKKYGQSVACVGVEIDAEIIRLFQKYVQPNLEQEITFFCGDAADFAANCKTKFDLICVDVFLDAVVPSQFGETPFLENLNQLLNPNAILIYNKLAHTTASRQESYFFYENVFKKQFPNADLLDVVGNYMLLNDKFF